jgi:hypothetical protein
MVFECDCMVRYVERKINNSWTPNNIPALGRDSQYFIGGDQRAKNISFARTFNSALKEIQTNGQNER